MPFYRTVVSWFVEGHDPRDQDFDMESALLLLDPEKVRGTILRFHWNNTFYSLDWHADTMYGKHTWPVKRRKVEERPSCHGTSLREKWQMSPRLRKRSFPSSSRFLSSFLLFSPSPLPAAAAAAAASTAIGVLCKLWWRVLNTFPLEKRNGCLHFPRAANQRRWIVKHKAPKRF